jgi:hypothetical protein
MACGTGLEKVGSRMRMRNVLSRKSETCSGASKLQDHRRVSARAPVAVARRERERPGLASRRKKIWVCTGCQQLRVRPERVSLTGDSRLLKEGHPCREVWTFDRGGEEKGARKEDEEKGDGKEREGRCSLFELD